VAAVVTAFDMATEGNGAAGLDGRRHLELIETDMTSMRRSPRRSVTTEDVGDLECGAHGGQPPGLGPSSICGPAFGEVCVPICTMILSSGLVTVRTTRVATRV